MHEIEKTTQSIRQINGLLKLNLKISDFNVYLSDKCFVQNYQLPKVRHMKINRAGIRECA